MKQQFKDQFLKLCEIEESTNAEVDMIRNFKCSSIDSFDQDFKKEHSELMNKALNPEQNARYKKFADEVDKIVVLDGSEEQSATNVTMIDADMMVKETQIYTDPISKLPIRDPVKNTICGHIYEKNTILGSIKLNKRVKCPYMGCSSKRPVTAENLQEDHQLKAKLNQLITQREEEMDEDDDY
jgi:SUMO ligase MMS21 Smc5/6 complex component